MWENKLEKKYQSNSIVDQQALTIGLNSVDLCKKEDGHV